jgi:hypothetical protein
MGGLQVRENLTGAVTGTVIDADQFEFQGDRKHAGNDFAQSSLLVIHGHDDRQFHGVCTKQ